MSYKVEAIPNFKKEAKQLAKKFRSLKTELIAIEDLRQQEPHKGTPLGNNCYKIRIAIESKGKGKRGGGRIITCVYVEQTTVFLLSIFDKSDQENISDEDLKAFLATAKEL